MEILLIISGIIAIPAIYLLFTPVRINLDIAYEGLIYKSITVKIFPFPSFTVSGRPGNLFSGVIKKIAGKKTLNALLSRPSSIYSIIRDDHGAIRGLTVTVIDYIKSILKTPENNYIDLSLHGGLHNPDETGILFGIIESLKPFLGQRIAVSYVPDFYAEGLSARLKTGSVFSGYKILKETLIFLYRLRKLQLLKIYLKLRRAA